MNTAQPIWLPQVKDDNVDEILQELKDSLLRLLLGAVTFSQSQKVQGPKLYIFKNNYPYILTELMCLL
jgi:hypothetical protein